MILSRTGRYGKLNDISPYVVKLEAWLRMAGVEYESELGLPQEFYPKSPLSSIPYLRLDGEILADSGLIISHLEQALGNPLAEAQLSPEDAAKGELIQVLCEERLFYIMVYGRWRDDGGVGINDYVNRALTGEDRDATDKANHEWVNTLLLHRIGRYDIDYVQNALRTCLDTLTLQLGGEPFLFGTTPSRYDAAMYGFLASFIYYPREYSHKAIAHEYPRLVAYCQHIDKLYFSDKQSWVDGS